MLRKSSESGHPGRPTASDWQGGAESMLGSSVPFLMVSWGLPPTATGSAVVVRNLLRWFGPDEVVMLGQVPYPGRVTLQGVENHRRIIIPSYPIYWRLKPWLDPFYVVPLAVQAGCATVHRHRLRVVMTVFPNVPFLLAGYLIAQRLQLPLFVYYHNLYVETRATAFGRVFARVMQKRIFARATRIFGISPGIADYIASKYGVPAVPLLHPINEQIPEFSAPPMPKAPFKVGFSGNVNATMAVPLRAMLHAIGNDPDYRIVLHTPTDPERIKRSLGEWADNVVTLDIDDTTKLLEAMRDCDVLVVGLADRSGSRDEEDFKTQFPTRTVEMLTAERPILVLCPPNYFLAKFFTTHGCGLLVDDTDPETIRNAVLHLCTDAALRSRCVANALRVAQCFRGDRVAALLRRELSVATGQGLA